jgi:hypothetical protein
MTLWEKIVAVYSELTDKDFIVGGCISLRNDGDGDYIERWDYEKPIPEGLKLGK